MPIFDWPEGSIASYLQLQLGETLKNLNDRSDKLQDAEEDLRELRKELFTYFINGYTQNAAGQPMPSNMIITEAIPDSSQYVQCSWIVETADVNNSNKWSLFDKGGFVSDTDEKKLQAIFNLLGNNIYNYCTEYYKHTEHNKIIDYISIMASILRDFTLAKDISMVAKTGAEHSSRLEIPVQDVLRPHEDFKTWKLKVCCCNVLPHKHTHTHTR